MVLSSICLLACLTYALTEKGLRPNASGEAIRQNSLTYALTEKGLRLDTDVPTG